jgi:hypothetical protein
MADNDFGLRIGINGERDFKRALADINQSFKLLGSEMTLVTSQFEMNDNSAKSLLIESIFSYRLENHRKVVYHHRCNIVPACFPAGAPECRFLHVTYE